MTIQHLIIDATQQGQRIDNYLFRVLKGVPKTRIYRAIRKGEVRVNKKRVAVDYRLQPQNVVRIPPIRQAQTKKPLKLNANFAKRLEKNIIYEDKHLLVLNKPAGYAVHGGSGIKLGIIETLRLQRTQCKFIELAHRLDRETSGCLLLAKKSSVLKQIHRLLEANLIEKRYYLLVCGKWRGEERLVDKALVKNQLLSGERMVRVRAEGKSAQTLFRPVQKFANCTLLEAKPVTGRTHQIRVHAAHIGHPIAGDEKYGDSAWNKKLRATGLRRLFLHAIELRFRLPEYDDELHFSVPLDAELVAFLHDSNTFTL